ncbi:bifunctional DNA primase/polymerase [Microbacterium sp. SSW1-59]|uniref:bifunctional DNA primase/polymerase n=1 Tax=Microbacterium xanthum TaxID=3079794 RepID=UPI002AD2C4CF|nr:bifunctional DNA primase/polymerase [Microbacterium sp. SSW1-59]MDZ8200631.1 bifunctional DNA primase/polymerase [Microbacterium sp. SSW1-59]
MSNLETALSLAAAGWYVFPLTPSGKFLEGFGWDRGASRSPKQIEEWWADDPRLSIGVHCGRSGLVVVDLDKKNGKDGLASLTAAGVALPRTFNYTSRGGKGTHHIFRAPKGVQLTIDRDLRGMPGVDIRSGIGMVAYSGPELVKRPKLAPAPEWALVHKKDGWDYDMADLEEWLAGAGEATDPEQKARAARSRRMATRFPEDGIGNGELLYPITKLVSGLEHGTGRRQAFEAARARYTANYPDPKYLIAFDRAWAKAITRVESDAQQPTVEPYPEDDDDLYVDVAAVLSGNVHRAKATVGLREDGQGLFYRGKINTLIGDPESGKTMIGACVAADVLSAGGRVLWLDLDHNGGSEITLLLRGFGVPDSVLLDRNKLRIASERLESRDGVLRAVLDAAEWGPDFVLLDSIGELVPLFGGSSNDADDYTSINRQVSVPLAAGGACVVSIDHLSKGHDSRAYGAGGTMAKKRAGNGAQYEVRVVTAFTPTEGGRADMWIVKDRPGDVRDHSPRDGKRQRAASFVMKRDHQDVTRWRFYSPDAEEAKPPKQELTVTVVTADQKLRADVDALHKLKPAPASRRDVEARMKWGPKRAGDALRHYRAELDVTVEEAADA